MPDFNPGFWFTKNSMLLSGWVVNTPLQHFLHMRQNIPSKGSKSYCCFNAIVPIWPYSIIQGPKSCVWVSQAVHLSKPSSSSPKFAWTHKGLQFRSRQPRQSHDAQVRGLRPGSQEFFLLSAKKRAACTFKGFPLHAKWLKTSLPPALAQTAQPRYCFLQPWSTKLGLFPQLMCHEYFCTIKLLHSFPPWKPLPRSKHPQKAKLKDSCLQMETLKMTMKKDKSEYSSSIQHLKCISFTWGMWNYRLLTNEEILYNTGDEEKQQTRTKCPRGMHFTSSPVMSVLLQRQCCHPSKMTAFPGLWWSPQPLRRFCNHSQF